MQYNNTYGIQAVNESRYEEVIDNLYKEGGCLDQIEQCRNISLVYDPTNQGFNQTVNGVCADAETFCSETIRDPYFDKDLNYYDISAPGAAAFPPPWYQGWLNQPHVQQGLGVPLNWTQSNSAVSKAFRSIGDYPRPGWKEDLAYLLEEGVKVTLVYGDRDYACNWYGGEKLSLAIPYDNQTAFTEAGYQPVHTNETYIGGQVRQHGTVSTKPVTRFLPTSPRPPTVSSPVPCSTEIFQPVTSPLPRISTTLPKDRAMYTTLPTNLS
jgi:carboxypeptidase C (cathepsin A)